MRTKEKRKLIKQNKQQRNLDTSAIFGEFQKMKKSEYFFIHENSSLFLDFNGIIISK